MPISWFSRRGTECSINEDAAAISPMADSMVALITDGARLRGCQKEDKETLARYWSRKIVERIVDECMWNSPGDIISVMQSEQSQLRHAYLHEIASYCFVSMMINTGDYFVLQCGDCQFGVKSLIGDGATHWLCEPHTLANHYRLVVPGTEAISRPKATENVLTRHLNAKRFHEPFVLKGVLLRSESILLCTDGFWRNNASDDMSVLEVSASYSEIHENSDSGNFLVI